MPFKNRIRLPFYLNKPQFPSTRNVFKLADGTAKTISVQLSKTYEGETDWIQEAWHQYLQIALSHDTVKIEGDRYLGNVAVDGDYQIEWSDFLDFPIAKAKFRLLVTPFDFSNSNCQTCEEATQLALADDYLTTLYTSINQGSTNTRNVFANDSICCKPVVAAVVKINSTYVQSASINAATGVITITLKAATPSGTNVNLVTYRVTCPNGSYDEADVFANVIGTVAPTSCSMPDFLEVAAITETAATPNWDWTLGAPAGVASFNYKLYLASNPAVAIDSGNTVAFSKTYSALNPGTCYIFTIQTVCSGGAGVSEIKTTTFCTLVSAGYCGTYTIYYYDGTPIPGGAPHVFGYIDCSGVHKHDFITNLNSKTICMLESSPGVPVELTGITSYSYGGPC